MSDIKDIIRLNPYVRQLWYNGISDKAKCERCGNEQKLHIAEFHYSGGVSEIKHVCNICIEETNCIGESTFFMNNCRIMTEGRINQILAWEKERGDL